MVFNGSRNWHLMGKVLLWLGHDYGLFIFDCVCVNNANNCQTILEIQNIKTV